MPNCGKKDCFWFDRHCLGMTAQAELLHIYGIERYLIHPCNECKFDEKYLVDRFRSSLFRNYIKNKRSKNAWVFKHKDLRIKEPKSKQCFVCKSYDAKIIFEIHSEFKQKDGNICGCVGESICIDCLVKIGKDGLKKEQQRISKHIESLGI